MGAPSDYFVDPAAGSDTTGAGTVGNPWQTLQHALDTITRDGTNGDRINLKAGTDDVLSAALDFSTYGAPSAAAPVIIQGYTAAAGDGGVGGISGGGSVSVINDTTLDYLQLRDLHLHNCGANPIVNVDNWVSVVNCEFDNATGDGFNGDQYCSVFGSHFHNIGGAGVNQQGGLVAYCTFEDGTNKFSPHAVTLAGISGGVCVCNVLRLNSTNNGISTGISFGVAFHNSIFQEAAGTGTGIIGTTGDRILNNLIEGFSGSGGKGISCSNCHIVAGNSIEDCATDISGGSDGEYAAGNESLGSSPFADAANGDFTPQDVGEVIGGALPAAWLDGGQTNNNDRGAVQSAGGGGGSTVIVVED